MSETKKCPYCAEDIQAAALCCRYCRSRLTAFDTEHWHRDHPEARVAGVCAALAHALSVPVAAVRLGFIVFSLIFHIAPVAYAGLWLIVPPKPGAESQIEKLLRAALDWIGAGPRREGPPNPRVDPEAGTRQLP